MPAAPVTRTKRIARGTATATPMITPSLLPPPLLVEDPSRTDRSADRVRRRVRTACAKAMARRTGIVIEEAGAEVGEGDGHRRAAVVCKEFARDDLLVGSCEAKVEQPHHADLAGVDAVELERGDVGLRRPLQPIDEAEARIDSDREPELIVPAMFIVSQDRERIHHTASVNMEDGAEQMEEPVAYRLVQFQEVKYSDSLTYCGPSVKL